MLEPQFCSAYLTLFIGGTGTDCFVFLCLVCPVFPASLACPFLNAPFLLGSMLLIFLVFCVVLLCVFTFWVLCCDCRSVTISSWNDDRFVSTSRCFYESPCLVYIVCVWWCSTHSVLCFYFVFRRLVCPMLPVPLDCPFLIGHSVFPKVLCTRM